MGLFDNVTPQQWDDLSNFSFATMAAGGRGDSTLGALGEGGLAMNAAAQQRAQTQNIQSETTSRNLQNALSLLPINQMRTAYGQPPITMPGVQNLMPDNNNRPSSAPAYMPTSNAAGAHNLLPTTTARPSVNVLPSGQPDNQVADYSGTSPQNDFLTDITNRNPSGTPPNTFDGRNAGQGITTVQTAPQTGADAYRRVLQVANGLVPPSSPQEATQALPFATNPNMAAYLKEWASAPAHIYEKTNSPMDVREGGSVINPATGKPIFQSPVPVDAVDAAGNKYRTWQTPAMNNNTPNTFDGRNAGQGLNQPGMMTELAPGAKKNIEGLMADFTGAEHKSYQSAQATGGQIAQMRQYFDVLNQNGWSSTGASADARLGLAKTVNGLETAIGVKPGDLSFDPYAIASSEGLYKNTRIMGMQLLNQYFGGAREAASTIMNTTSAVPGLSNTYTGAKVLLSGMEETANYQKDLYDFKSEWAQDHSGDLRGAENTFNKQSPPESYAMRAISQEKSIRVNNYAGYRRLLSGTVYLAPDGSKRVVPAASSQLMQ